MATWYGKTPGDVIARDTDADSQPDVLAPGAVLTIWDSESGGVQITDLLDEDSNAVTEVAADAKGRAVFGRPADGAGDVWGEDSDGTRWLFHPTDLLERIEEGGIGPTGPAGTVAVGTVTSGTSAAVVNVGTSTAATLNFTLPKGDTGDKGDRGPSATKELSVYVAGEVPGGMNSIQTTIYEPHRLIGIGGDIAVPPQSQRLQFEFLANGVSPYQTLGDRPEIPRNQTSAILKPPEAGRDLYASGTKWRLNITDAGGEEGSVALAPAPLAQGIKSSGTSSQVNFQSLATKADGLLDPSGAALADGWQVPAGALIRVVAISSLAMAAPATGWTTKLADVAATATHGFMAERIATGVPSEDRGLFTIPGGVPGVVIWLTEVFDNPGDTVADGSATTSTTTVTSFATPTLTSTVNDELASYYVGGWLAATGGVGVTATVAPSGVSGTTEVVDSSTTRSASTNVFLAAYRKSLPTAGAGGGALTGTITTTPGGQAARMVGLTARTQPSTVAGSPGEDLVARLIYEVVDETEVQGE